MRGLLIFCVSILYQKRLVIATIQNETHFFTFKSGIKSAVYDANQRNAPHET